MRGEQSALLEERARIVLADLKADHGGVVQAGTVIEALLADRLGATGLGLGTKFREVEARLPEDLVHRLRFITAVRNDISHNPLAEIQKPEQFVAAAREVIHALLQWQEAPRPPLRQRAGNSPAAGGSFKKPLAVGVALCALVFFFAGHRRNPPGAPPLPAPRVKEAMSRTEVAPPPAALPVIETPSTDESMAASPPPVPAVRTLPRRKPQVNATPEPPIGASEQAIPDTPAAPGDALTLDQLRAIRGRL